MFKSLTKVGIWSRFLTPTLNIAPFLSVFVIGAAKPPFSYLVNNLGCHAYGYQYWRSFLCVSRLCVSNKGAILGILVSRLNNRW